MNIIKLYIDGYKNLNCFETHFNDSESLNLIYGKNGSGKSNYFEALSAIFDDLYKRTGLLERYRGLRDEVSEKVELLDFNYQIDFVSKGTYVNIEYSQNNLIDSSDFTSDIECFNVYVDNEKKEFEDIGRLLPRNIFGYYSGETSRLKKYFQRNIFEYSKNLRSSITDSNFARLVFVNEQVLDYIMIVLKVFSEELQSNTGFTSDLIDSITEITFRFNSPKLEYSDYFHGLDGELLRTLELLTKCGKSNEGRKGQISSLTLYDKYSFGELKNILDNEFVSMRLFFENLMNLKYSGIIRNVEVNVNRGNEFSLFNLSEGEKQLLTIIGMLTIQKDSDCIFLLDEPDAFLYPQWQRELTEQINNIEVNGQILLSTHSPLSLGEVARENILLFENGHAINPPINTYGTTSEAVLEVVMGVEERNSKFSVLIDEFDVSVAKRNIGKCKEIVLELKNMGLPEDDVFFLEAEAEIIRLEVLLEENN